MTNEIPDSWHHGCRAYNCLTDEEFKKFQETHTTEDSFPCECDECGEYQVDEYHRCLCGNRRCSIVYDTTHDFFYVECW